ncbi:MAG: hypothetical protein ABEJ83_04065 [Candidatus Nanohaloarchaea archaeon]
MKQETEERLRGPLLILVLVLILLTLVVLIKALTNSNWMAIGGLVVGALSFIWGVYRDFLELGPRETKSDTSIDKSTYGTRPDASYEALDITPEDIELSQMSPRELAQTIINSPNWRFAGKEEHLGLIRPRLKLLIEREGLSTKWLEASILSLTIACMSIFFIGFFSLFAVTDEVMIFNIASSIYPQGLPPSINGAILIISFLTFAAGLYYFSLKNILQCTACNRDFALSTHGRYFKPEYQKIEERENGKIRVTRGVRLFKCDDCGKWSVCPDKWKEELDNSWN